MPLQLEQINSAREKKISDKRIVDSISRNFPDYADNIAEARKKNISDQRIVDALHRKLSMPQQQPQEQQQPEQMQQAVPGEQGLPQQQYGQQQGMGQPQQETPASLLAYQQAYGQPAQPPSAKESKDRYGDAAAIGLQSSISGELARLGFNQKEIPQLEEPGFWESVVQSAGNIAGNAPYYAPGAVLGASVGSALGSAVGPAGTGAGALLGGSAGAFAFAAFLEESLKQYREHTEQGNDLTFGEFLERADKVANRTLNEGAMGVILGMVNKAAPLLKNIPSIGKLFSTKIGAKAAATGLESAVLATVPAIAQGRAPTANDFAHSMALVLGIKLAMKPAAMLKMANAASKHNLTAEQLAREMQKISDKPIEDMQSLESTLKKVDESFSKSKQDTAEKASKEILRDIVPREIKATESPETPTTNKVESVALSPEAQARKEIRKILDTPEKKQERADQERQVKNERSSEVFKEKVGKSEKESKQTKEETTKRIESDIESLEGNRKKLAERAVKQKIVETPEQLQDLMRDYNELYPNLKGNVKDRNRKLLSQYIKKNRKTIEQREQGNVPRPEMTEQQKLKQYVVEYRRAKGIGDKAGIKEAKRKIDLQKRRIKRLEQEKQEQEAKREVTSDIKQDKTIVVNNEQVTAEESPSDNKFSPSDKAKARMEAVASLNIGMPQSAKSETSKKVAAVSDTKVNVDAVERNIEKLESKLKVAQDKGDEARIRAIAKNLTIQRKKLKTKKKKKEPKPIIETTGKSAHEMIDNLETPTVKERIVNATNSAVRAIKNPTESLSAAGRTINEQIFNFLAPLERLESKIPVDQQVTSRIRLAQSSMSTVNSIIENGIFSDLGNQLEHGGLKDAYGDYTWKRMTKNAKPGEYSIEDLNAYRHSKQALIRQKQGFKTGIDTKKAEDTVRNLRHKYEKVYEDISDYNKAVNSRYGKHTLGDEKIDQWNSDQHTSLFRCMDSGKDPMLANGSLEPRKWYHVFKGSERKQIPASESDVYNTAMIVQTSKKNDAVLQYKKNVEKGLVPGKIRKSEKIKMPQDLMDKLEIPENLRDLADTIYSQTRSDSFAPSKNTIRGWENGKSFEIVVPEEVADIFRNIQPANHSIIHKALAAVNSNFSRSLTITPSSFFSIARRDALNAMMYSKTGVTPVDVAKAISHVIGDTSIYKQFKFDGGDAYAGRLASRMDRANKLQDLVTPGREGPIVSAENLASYLRKYEKKLGDLSTAVPLAEYTKGLEKYGNTPEGRILAMMDAKSVTYDPARKGKNKILRELSPVINFLNVTLQDAAMLAKNLHRKEVIAYGIATISMPALALKFWNEGNPNYDSLTNDDKAAFWHLFFGDFHIRVATRWLVATIFKVIPEALYETAMGRAGDGFDALYRNAVDQFSGNFNPLIQTSIELMTGKSPASPLGAILGVESKSPEVAPRRLQNLPKEYQYTSNTSQLSRTFAPLLGASPVVADRVINNFFPTLGRTGLALMDEIAYQTGIAQDNRPDQGYSNYLLLGNFLQDSTPKRTKYAEQFYEYMEQYRMGKAAVKFGAPQKDLKRLENAHLNQYNTKINKLFHKYRDLQDSKMNAAEKKQQMKETQQQINDLYKEAVLRANKRDS